MNLNPEGRSPSNPPFKAGLTYGRSETATEKGKWK
jgi:hypothetical protein